jgi:hypothetical protein
MMLSTVIRLHGVISRLEVPVPRAGLTRLLAAALGGLAAAVLSSPGVVWAADSTGGPVAGPAQINAPGQPGLCWQAEGNGSPVTLEHCDQGVQGQQWTLNGDGVLLNGNGYCLEAGTGGSLFAGFDGQCDGGETGQQWAFSGTTGQLSSRGPAGCAGPDGALEPGTAIVAGACDSSARWSFGYSAVTLAAGSGTGTAGGPYRAVVTAANGASAQTAYGVSVRLTAPSGLRVTGLTGPGAAWTCRVTTMTCTGTLAAGTAAAITMTGRVPAGVRPGRSYRVTATASVQGTSPAPDAKPAQVAARVTVGRGTQPSVKSKSGAAAAGPTAGQASGGTAALMTAGLLVFGGLLVLAGRRSRRRAAGGPARAPEGTRRAVGETGQAEAVRVRGWATAREDDGPYVVDVTEEVRRRRAAPAVVDLRPTEPFDVSSIL